MTDTNEKPYRVVDDEYTEGRYQIVGGPIVHGMSYGIKKWAEDACEDLNAAHAQGKREGLAGAEDVRAVMQEYIDSVDKMDFVNASDCISYTKRLMIAALSSLAPTTQQAGGEA